MEFGKDGLGNSKNGRTVKNTPIINVNKYNSQTLRNE
jgi:hypothetical protein